MAGDIGDQNLPTLGCCADPRRGVHRFSGDLFARLIDLTRVEPDTNVKLWSAPLPVKRVEGALDRDRACDGTLGGDEHDKEAVA